MTEEELKARLRDFALRAFRVCDALPHTPAGRTIAGQLARSGSSPGANYRAACRAKSGPDFVNKLAIAEEEMDESGWWLDLIIRGRLLNGTRLYPLLQESDELTRILTSSRITAKRSLERKKGKPREDRPPEQKDYPK